MRSDVLTHMEREVSSEEMEISLCARIPVFDDHVLRREFKSKTKCPAFYISTEIY